MRPACDPFSLDAILKLATETVFNEESADLNDATLEAAAQEIAMASFDEAQLRQAREIALAHFGLDVAIRNYAGLIETILQHRAILSLR